MSFPAVVQAVGGSPSATYGANALALALLVVLGPTCGVLSDRLGRRKVLMFGYFATAAIVIPVVALLWDPSDIWRVYAAQLLVVIPFAAILGPVTAPLLEQLPPNLRGVGYGFLWACAMALFGGTGPMISTWLAARGINFLMSSYFLVMLITAGVLTFTMKETAFSPTEGETSSAQQSP
jgi:MFS family permease